MKNFWKGVGALYVAVATVVFTFEYTLKPNSQTLQVNDMQDPTKVDHELSLRVRRWWFFDRGPYRLQTDSKSRDLYYKEDGKLHFLDEEHWLNSPPESRYRRD